MESINILQFLNISLDFFHLFLMLLILFGWLIPPLRKLHLTVALLIGITWLIFMKNNGIGYCIFTDWHWQILTKLGKTDLPESYSQYLYERLTGLTIQKNTAQAIILYYWIGSSILSSILLYRRYLYERKLKITD